MRVMGDEAGARVALGLRMRRGRRRSHLSGRSEMERAAQVALMQEAVARAWNVPLNELRASTRCKAPVALARQVAMYLTHVSFGMNLSAVGRHFGRDRTTAAHACRQIEDKRDDREFDLMLDRLEFAVSSRPVMEMRQ